MSVTAAPGFEAGGLASGIKSSGAPDLAIVATTDHRGVAATGVFTSNLVAAAPVQISQIHLHDGQAAAVVLSSGNANAATGEAGRRDALRMAELTAVSLGCVPRDVLVCSTGLIGIPMPMDPVEAGIPKLATTLTADDAGGAAAATAILTTDTVRKETVQQVELAHGVVATIGGMAKGAAMLSPAMATMLAVLTTDAAVDPSTLRTMLTRAVADSFNSLIVDDCTSTNDTVLLLANGALGNAPITRSSRAYEAFGDGLAAACADSGAPDGGRRRGCHEARDHRRTRRTVGGRGAHRCPRGGAQPTGAVLAVRQRPVLGSGALGARSQRRPLQSGARRDRVPGRAGVSRRHRRTARRVRLGAADARRATSRSIATCTPAPARQP